MRFERLRRRSDPSRTGVAAELPHPTAGTTGPMHSACYAPHSALYLRPDGQVHACCVTGFSLGTVFGPRRESLRSIWEGARLAAQRRALEDDSFEVGCQECEWVASSGGRDAAMPHHFDRFADGAPHRYPKLLDLALSSRCNLQCVMCNGGLSSAIRTQREGLPPLPAAYDDEFFDELDDFLPHVERFQFKGGEPFLAPENRRIWERLIEQHLQPEVTVTTNGTVVNDDVVRYVTELRMHPNVSVDGVDAATLESIRVGVDAVKLWRNIDRFQELAEVAGNGMTLSFCLVQSNWQELQPFLLEADRRDVNCNVILVNQPAEHDLLRLPHDVLDRVHRTLVDRRLDLRHPAAVAAQDEVIDRLASHLEHPVELVVRSTYSAAVALQSSAQHDLARAITEHYGRPPLRLTTVGGLVDDVDAPDWSQWLGSERFVGRPIDSLLGLLDGGAGDSTARVMKSLSADVDAMELIVGSAPDARRLSVYHFVDAVTGERRALVVEMPSIDRSE